MNFLGLATRSVKLHCKALGFALTICTVAGCSSLVAVVDYETDFAITRPAGQVGASPSELVVKTRASIDENTFSVARETKKVVWLILAGSGISGEIGNYGAESFCVNLRDARLSTNFRPEAAPLPVTVQRVVAGNRVSVTPSVSYGRVIELSTLCVAPGERAQYSLQMHRTAPSPSGFLFNAPDTVEDPTLMNSLKGNWVRIVLPYSIGKWTETLVATFTATGAKTVRVSW